MRFEQQLINKSHKHSKNTLGAKVATATKPEGEGTAGVIAFKASGAKLLQDKKRLRPSLLQHGDSFCQGISPYKLDSNSTPYIHPAPNLGRYQTRMFRPFCGRASSPRQVACLVWNSTNLRPWGISTDRKPAECNGLFSGG